MHFSTAGQIRISRSSTVSVGFKPAGMAVSTPSTIDVDGIKYSLIAFYYPGRETHWDKKYNAAFLANFYSCPVVLTINGESGEFQSAEAAYQAIKWWDKKDADGIAIRPQFELCEKGSDAFRLRCRLAGYRGIKGEVPDWDHSYLGLQRQGAMLAVTAAKFSKNRLKMALLATGNSYLLEHNSRVNRESYWSDNHDGSGHNHMGKLLMKLRYQLGGAGNPAPEMNVANFTHQVLD